MMRAVPALASPMKRLLAVSLAFVAVFAHADEPKRPDLPLWELGVAVGTLSQQAYPGADEQVRPYAGAALRHLPG